LIAFRYLLSILIVAAISVAQPAAALKILAFGDSLTAGIGDENGKGYPPKLGKLLGEGSTVENLGEPGETTALGLTRIDSALSLGGDGLILMEGTNDVSEVFDGLISIESVVANIEAMVSKTESAGIEPILAAIVPRPANSSRDSANELTRAYVQELREVAISRNLRFVDTFDLFDPVLEPKSFSLYYSKDAADRIGHLNNNGYQALAAFIADLLNEIDTARPVVGSFVPGTSIAIVEPDTEILVPVYDYLGSAGLNLEETKLMINGRIVAVGSESEGSVSRVVLRHKGQKALGCRSLLQVVAEDRAEPPHRIERTLATYDVAGRRVITGDVDFDCRVDGVDLVSFALRFGVESNDPLYAVRFDFNADGVIDGEDFAVLASNFGKASR